MTEPKSAEVAAKEYAKKYDSSECHDFCLESTFLDGVEWQREQDKSDMTAAYLVGYQKAKEREALLVEALEIALEKTKDVAKSWHGEIAWDIYENHAPEMKPYREARAALLKYRGEE